MLDYRTPPNAGWVFLREQLDDGSGATVNGAGGATTAGQRYDAGVPEASAGRPGNPVASVRDLRKRWPTGLAKLDSDVQRITDRRKIGRAIGRK